MRNNAKRVLIGIVSKNRYSILPKAIASALFQRNVNYIVSIFDDNSSDETKSLEKDFSNVHWFFSNINRGYVYARNKLMRETDCEFYCSLDDDSWFITPDALEIAINQFDLDAKIAAIGFDIISPDQPNPSNTPEIIETNDFVGCGHVLKLSAVKEVGYYDENPGFYGGEEKDLCIKLMDAGYKIVKLSQVCVWHDKTMMSRDIKKQYRSVVCNSLVFAFRRIPGRKMWFLLLYKTYSLFVFSLRSNKFKFLLPFFKGLVDFIANLFTKKLKREPVSEETFIRFFSFDHNLSLLSFFFKK